jgi:hypothetical protein
MNQPSREAGMVPFGPQPSKEEQGGGDEREADQADSCQRDHWLGIEAEGEDGDTKVWKQ